MNTGDPGTVIPTKDTNVIINTPTIVENGPGLAIPDGNGGWVLSQSGNLVTGDQAIAIPDGSGGWIFHKSTPTSLVPTTRSWFLVYGHADETTPTYWQFQQILALTGYTGFNNPLIQVDSNGKPHIVFHSADGCQIYHIWRELLASIPSGHTGDIVMNDGTYGWVQEIAYDITDHLGTGESVPGYAGISYAFNSWNSYAFSIQADDTLNIALSYEVTTTTGYRIGLALISRAEGFTDWENWTEDTVVDSPASSSTFYNLLQWHFQRMTLDFDGSGNVMLQAARFFNGGPGFGYKNIINRAHWRKVSGTWTDTSIDPDEGNLFLAQAGVNAGRVYHAYAYYSTSPYSYYPSFEYWNGSSWTQLGVINTCLIDWNAAPGGIVTYSDVRGYSTPEGLPAIAWAQIPVAVCDGTYGYPALAGRLLLLTPTDETLTGWSLKVLEVTAHNEYIGPLRMCNRLAMFYKDAEDDFRIIVNIGRYPTNLGIGSLRLLRYWEDSGIWYRNDITLIPYTSTLVPEEGNTLLGMSAVGGNAIKASGHRDKMHLALVLHDYSVPPDNAYSGQTVHLLVNCTYHVA
jgi:hypothetical protein